MSGDVLTCDLCGHAQEPGEAFTGFGHDDGTLVWVCEDCLISDTGVLTRTPEPHSENECHIV